MLSKALYYKVCRQSFGLCLAEHPPRCVLMKGTRLDIVYCSHPPIWKKKSNQHATRMLSVFLNAFYSRDTQAHYYVL